MIVNPIAIKKSIRYDQLNASEMVDETQACYEKLDPCHRDMFVEWLQSQSNQVKTAANIVEDLTAWLESLQYENLQWGIRVIIIGEIDW